MYIQALIIPIIVTRYSQNCYSPILSYLLPSKTKETAFQILNRTVWTNNKAFKSGTSDPPYAINAKELKRWNTSYISALTI
jgi:hypothetical protein